MAEEKPKASVTISDFGGLVTSVDPRDIQPGMAQVQVNICAIRGAQLEVRSGIKQLQFEA